MENKFSVPPKVQARLEHKHAPVVKPAPKESGEIVIISDWHEYHAQHPELVFSGRFDLQGRPIFSPEAE